MRLVTGLCLFVAHVAFMLPPTMHAQQSPPGIESVEPTPANRQGSLWSDAKVEHVDGLPDIKPHAKGSLSLDGNELTFTGKAARTAIPRSSITAVSAGNQRVELWGITGRIIRMAIPDNGGLAVAAVAHHRIDMLTVDFSDGQGGRHSAVFFLGANHASEALDHFAIAPVSVPAVRTLDCRTAETESRTLLIASPDWNGAHVPAAYEGLVYEHLLERFRKAKGLTHVYREGERIPDGLCPQYVLRLSITGFKEGSSVERAMLGPVGMFVGTTQMSFDVELTDRTNAIHIQEQIKSNVRGENESTGVADIIAKSLKKKYEKALEKHNREMEAKS